MKIVKISNRPNNKADKFFKGFKKVLYRVTGLFGLSKEGEIREAYLINTDGAMSLIYHPSGRDGCGNFEFCVFVSPYYISANEEYYVNYGKFGI